VSFCVKEGIGGFLPALPSPPIFVKDAKFKHFLLTKIVNAERAAMRYAYDSIFFFLKVTNMI
jgi:hypothetical protein